MGHDHRHGDRWALLTTLKQKLAYWQTAPGPFGLGAVLFIVLSMMAAQVLGQREPIHYFHSGDMPPGAIGQGQLLRGGPLPGYFQPVEIKVPQGAAVSMAVDGHFESPREFFFTSIGNNTALPQIWPNGHWTVASITGWGPSMF